MPTPPRRDPKNSGLRQASALLAIPTLLIVSPLVGFFLGRLGDDRFHTHPWLTVTGLVLGFVAAGREVWQIYRRFQSEEER